MPLRALDDGPAPGAAAPHQLVRACTLETARETAARCPDRYPMYSPEALDRMRTEFTRRSGGHTLYDWHATVGEALLLELDVTIVAPTNAGKTVVNYLPLLAAPPGEKRRVLSLCPLKLLGDEQVRRDLIFIDYLLTPSTEDPR
jgi:hypothetical protein